MQNEVDFEFRTGNPEKVLKFYEQLFGWRIQKDLESDRYQIEGEDPYGNNGFIGWMKRKDSQVERSRTIIDVASLDGFLEKVETLGGEVHHSRIVIPGYGYLGVCSDIGGNVFRLLEENREARN